MTEKNDLNIDYTIYQIECTCFGTVESYVLLSHTQYAGSTLYMLISCTPDKDIRKETLSYPCYFTQAVTRGLHLHTLVVLELTHMVVKLRYCCVKVTSSYCI